MKLLIEINEPMRSFIQTEISLQQAWGAVIATDDPDFEEIFGFSVSELEDAVQALHEAIRLMETHHETSSR